MPEWLTGLLTALLLALIGFLLWHAKRKINKHNEQIEAVAALRYELQSNLLWLDEVFESRNFLRTEAWGIIKNKGYISYLQAPIPLKVILVYDRIYRLNDQIRLLKEDSPAFIRENAEKIKIDLKKQFLTLIEFLDKKYPRIAKNYRL